LKPRLAQATILAGTSAYIFQRQVEAEAAPAVDWEAVKKDLAELVTDEDVPNKGADNFPGAVGGGGYVGPMMIRLAWHSAGSYCATAKNGGSDGGTMRFAPESEFGANAGLVNARNLIELVKKRHPGASYADLYILAGYTAVKEMGGPEIEFRPGRTDAPGPAAPEADARFSPDGRLPDADKGDILSSAQHVRDIFYRMGFNDQEIVALSGAHSVGFCHTDRSGYWGPWSFSPNMFSNEYYRLLLDEEWTVKKHHNNGHWDGPLQYEDPSGNLMMLPSDMTLKYDNKFKKYALEYKNNEEKFFTDFAAAFKKLTELGVKFD